MVDNTADRSPAVIISNVFATRVSAMLKKTRLTIEVLFWLKFCFFMLGFSNGIDSQVSLPCFFSICAIAPLTIYLI